MQVVQSTNEYLMKRYCPSKAFPPYAFTPGQNPHPEKEGGHMFGQVVSVNSLSETNFQDNQDYLYAFDLFNNGFYWESHVFWEAIWHKEGRKGPSADLLKGLIKIAAAMVKKTMNQLDLADGHITRAIELFEPLRAQKAFHGVKVEPLIKELEKTKEKEELYSSLKLVLEDIA